MFKKGKQFTSFLHLARLAISRREFNDDFVMQFITHTTEPFSVKQS